MKSGNLVNETIINDEVLLDGSFISNCHLKDCKLIYRATGKVTMQNSAFDNCRIVFDGPAADTMDLLKSFYAQGGGFRDWAISAIKLIRGERPGGMVA